MTNKINHYEKQTYRSFWKFHDIFSVTQAWFCFYLLQGNSMQESTKLAADHNNDTDYPINDKEK